MEASRMTVGEVIEMAKFGELRNLVVGPDEDRAIVSYLNLGLIELYKRFPLSVKEYLLELSADQEIYQLPSDCMWVITAYGEVPADMRSVYTNELEINNEDNPLSINTVGWNQIQVPIAVDSAYVSLIYAAGPDSSQKITYDELGNYKQSDISVPLQLIEPLLHYVGYRAHGAMDGNVQADNNTHYVRFDASCKKIKAEGMITHDNLNMDYRITDRGYI